MGNRDEHRLPPQYTCMPYVIISNQNDLLLAYYHCLPINNVKTCAPRSSCCLPVFLILIIMMSWHKNTAYCSGCKGNNNNYYFKNIYIMMLHYYKI